MNRCKYTRVIKKPRVPLGVLLALILSTNLSIISHAETITELKTYLGYTSEQIEETIKEYKENEPKEGIDLAYSYEASDDTASLERLKEKSDSARIELETMYKSQSNPNKILALLDTYNSTSMKYNNKLKINRSQVSTELASGYKNENIINFVDFDIGTIGVYMQTPTKSLTIETPYGYPISESEEDEVRTIKAIGDKHSGIDLAINKGEDVLAQWNGKVVNVSEEELGLYQIEIYHGNGLTTEYSHIDSPAVKIGQFVSQYEIIGTAGNSSGCKCNLSFQGKQIEDRGNHIHFGVRLDKKYINPLLLYQENGKGAYEKWLGGSIYKYALPDGEEMYKTPDKDTIIDHSNTGMKYIEEVMYDFNNKLESDKTDENIDETLEEVNGPIELEEEQYEIQD